MELLVKVTLAAVQQTITLAAGVVEQGPLAVVVHLELAVTVLRVRLLALLLLMLVAAVAGNVAPPLPLVALAVVVKAQLTPLTQMQPLMMVESI
jgi:hypothetical protein